MNKQLYIPDRTWKNIWTVLRANKSTVIVLACKDCPEGVTPKEKLYIFALLPICFFLGAFLFIVLRDNINSFVYMMIPQGWSKSIKTLISALFAILCWLSVAPIVVLLSFRLTKWVPVSNQ